MKYGCSTTSHDWYRAKTDIDQIRHYLRNYCSCHWKENKKVEKSDRTLRFDLEKVCFVPFKKTAVPVGSISYGGCLPDTDHLLSQPCCFFFVFCFFLFGRPIFTLNICWLRLRRNLSYCAKSTILGGCGVLVLIFLDLEPPGGPSTQSARRSRPLGLSTGI